MYFLQLQGGGDAVIEALGRRDVARAPIPEAERALMRFVVLVTEHAYRTTAEDVQLLRDAGWTDEQIGEAVYITAIFAFFNRVADAFGLTDPGYLSLGTPTALGAAVGTTTSPAHGPMQAPLHPSPGVSPAAAPPTA